MTIMTREETLLDLQKYLNDKVPRVIEEHSKERARSELHGSRYVVYTGSKDCPVWVDYVVAPGAPSRIGAGFGVLNVSKFDSAAVARTLAATTRNGLGEVGVACTYMEALDMELACLKRLAETLNLQYPA